MNNFPYQVGGSLQVNSPTYVTRKADSELYQSLKAGEFCYVLNSRQMGKSSLLVRTIKRLRTDGFICEAIDLSDLGSKSLEQWYGGVAYKLASSFNLFEPMEFMNWWQTRSLISPVQRLGELISEILAHVRDSSFNSLKSESGQDQQDSPSIVIFIDEIDSTLSLKESIDDFFALIRSFYNQRACNADYQRLTFVLLGVATPSDLIRDSSRTPFNIGRAIDLAGFTKTEAKPLLKGLESKYPNAEIVLDEILSWTGGQPFLTQKLCQLLLNHDLSVEEIVRACIIENWENQDEPPHLKTIRDRLSRNPDRASKLLGLYQQVLQGDTSSNSLPNAGLIPSESTPCRSPFLTELKLSGLVAIRGGELTVYNPIYREIFNLKWVEKMLLDLRPYGEAIAAWFAANCQDESRLLRGNALEEAQNWANGKQLSSQDYHFLAASAEAEMTALRQQQQRSRSQMEQLQREKTLLEELTQEQERRKATEAALQRQLQNQTRRLTANWGAVISIAAFLTGVFWVNASINRQNTRLNQLSSYSQAMLEENRPVEAVIASLEAVKEMRGSLGINSATRMRAILALQQAISQLSPTLLVTPFIREDSRESTSNTRKIRAEPKKDGRIEVVRSRRDPRSGARDDTILATLVGHKEPILAVSISPNNRAIASASADGTARLWQRDGTLLAILKHPGTVTSVSFSFDSQILATASTDNQVRLWHLDGTLLATLTRQPSRGNPISQVNFTPDGKLLAADDNNATLLQWNFNPEQLWTQGCNTIQSLPHLPKPSPCR
ncbi:MAG: AAA-like domain-containing protein [Cyanobacteriota bacterium]|nr:AAA-like domain-containing protein [Cyanobacteriota bacterium]